MKSIILLIIIASSTYAKNILLKSSLPYKYIRATKEIKRQFYKKLYGVISYLNKLIYVDKEATNHCYKYFNDPSKGV